MRKSRIREDEEKWETSSLAWIHRIRREMALRGEKGPMPLALQKALAKKYGSSLVRPRKKSAVTR